MRRMGRAGADGPRAGRAGILRPILIALLASAVAANLFLIYFFSSETGEASARRSGRVTAWVARCLYADYDDMTEREQQRIAERLHPPLRKAAHFSEFALLGYLSAGLTLLLDGRLTRRAGRRLGAALPWIVPGGLCLLCALLDELHQRFVPGRGCSARDALLFDFVGALCGVCLIQGAAAAVRAAARSRRRARPSPDARDGRPA